MLKLCVLFFIIVPAINPNRSCNIISTNLPTVTTPGGVITNGTQNVILYCICVQENVAVGPTLWYFNGVQVTLTEDDESGAPYFRNNVPSPLIIPSFVTGNDGIYHCGSVFTIIPTPDDTITLLGMYHIVGFIYCLRIPVKLNKSGTNFSEFLKLTRMIKTIKNSKNK